MKTKNKVLASLEIAIVLCSVFLMAIPAIAAEQTTQEANASANAITTTSEDDFVLDIYGNANEDDTIDMRDLTYVKLIFFGKKPETELADAKYDGKINPLDFIQIKLIIVGKEKELTIVDTVDRIVTVKKPVERIVILHHLFADVLRPLGAKDKIIGVPTWITDKPTYFPDLSKLPIASNAWKPDPEAIINLNPDLVITYGTWGESLDKDLKKIVPVVRLTCALSTIEEDIKKLGYILGKTKEAEELINFYEVQQSSIKSRIAGLSEDEKPRVYSEYSAYKVMGMGSAGHEMLTIAGGINIAADLTGYLDVDPEWVIVQNPDIILARPRHGYDASCGYEEDDPSSVKEFRDKILNRPELAEVTAVKNAKVYCYTADISSGPSYLIGTLYMAKWFYPELFKDLNPKAIHQEYLTEFQGLDYDLDKHGVFVYPEPS